ncbi:MAG: helix-turn-helix transcriptional regulator, partial [bacterium]|nr:helix-turn-helix transcriptional regulator [bacterium]
MSSGLSQGELAARAGVSQPMISAYERGRREPSIATLSRLVAAAGCELEIDVRPVEEPGRAIS